MREIAVRKSIRKYKSDAIRKEDIDTIIQAGILAPSAKNRQPWKYFVYTGNQKENLLNVMEKGLIRERDGKKIITKFSKWITRCISYIESNARSTSTNCD